MTNVLLMFHALAAGGMLAVQLGVNARLSAVIGHPVSAALFSFVVGMAALIVYAMALRLPFPVIATVRTAPWWALVGGGLLGAFYVSSVILLAPKLGAAVTLTAVIAGQVLMSMVIDHFGWFGIPPNPVTLARAFGACLVIGGVAVIRFA